MRADKGNSTEREIKIEVDEELIRKLEALPDKKIGAEQHHFKPEEDALLLKYWPIKRHMDVAKILGISKTTALYRYRELIEGDAQKRQE